ncbi:ISAon1 family transposase N-terminal region protein [Pseudotamlana carrageenivorans]|uniref:Transposase n=1 Tax=Pseudotamlana carrageenivorans TaxID=2069432 RepID=A0A2I7SI35_9FLAO|nr:transposase [Tamlana carrageenivorans]AUS04225.1 transposase [Tamlana carrageenivorans]AUS05385.1 transposase [Tamlana carrageenivorans]AUS05561.1 transposase [Tamlana carrageenivorans]AUS05805.1 transposase [Tamlana carrageenivorans]AUS06945.1 transposase [Tamlana carrageenivorans]
MSSDSLLAIANLLLPEILMKYFDLDKHEIKGEALHFYFTELNTIPEEFNGTKLHSKGFFSEATVQDFPIRGKNVYLHIKRRRWLNKQTNEVVHRDWNLVAQGTRMTAEFADFLKEISPY